MKKYIVKMVALCSTIFLSLASQTNNIWAGESYKINNTVAKNYEVKYENITKLDLKTEKQLSNNKIKDYLTEQVKTQNSEVAVEEDSTSKIYYGTMTGKLSKTNDYLMYPAKLSAGEYLQAKLTLPTDPQIDYDLLLFDSSLSLIKSSDYVTCTTSEMATLDESIGYIANKDEIHRYVEETQRTKSGRQNMACVRKQKLELFMRARFWNICYFRICLHFMKQAIMV